MKEYTVYLHISPDGKRYYGATKQNVNRRWRKNGEGYRGNKNFTNVIEKYGWDNFQHIVIAKGLTKEEAHWLEIELIKAWDTTNPDKGYNITKGGASANGWNPPEETRKKLSKARKGKCVGKNNPMYGKYGENSPRYGKHHTEEARKKMSENSRGKYIGKNSPRAKAVICITTKRIFHTAKEGGEYYNCASSSIIRCCQGKLKSAGKLNETKLVWRYLVWNHNKIYRKRLNK